MPSFRVIGAGGKGVWSLELGDVLEVRLERARCCAVGLLARHSAASES